MTKQLSFSGKLNSYRDICCTVHVPALSLDLEDIDNDEFILLFGGNIPPEIMGDAITSCRSCGARCEVCGWEDRSHLETNAINFIIRADSKGKWVARLSNNYVELIDLEDGTDPIEIRCSKTVVNFLQQNRLVSLDIEI